MNNKDKKELFDILDQALDRVLKGEDLHTVLADYPRFADELEPLLKTALDTRNAAALKPRPEFRQRAALEFQKTIQQMPVKPVSNAPGASTKSRGQRRGIFGWGTAWSAAMAVILLVLVSGTGVVTAANYAMPDNPLYSVKLASESVQLAFTPSDTGKAKLYADLNDRRVAEVIDMADKGNTAEISVLNSRMTDNMNKMSELTSREDTVHNENDTSLKAQYGLSGASPMYSEQTNAAPASTTVPAVTMTRTQTTVATTTMAAPTTVTATQPPAATPAPTTTNVVVAPSVTAAAPPDDITIGPPPAMDSSERYSSKGQNILHNALEDKWKQLRDILTEKQIKNLQELAEAYRDVSDSLKPSILESIKIIVNGYGLSFSNSSVIYDLLAGYGISLADLED
jgi:hypothetical protein